jgi:general secretion pathway protein C
MEGDKLCQVSLFPVDLPQADAPKRKKKGKDKEDEEEEEEPAAPAPQPGRPGGRAVDPAIASKIKKVSETEFEIDRSAIDKILDNQAELMRSARIVPEQKDGQTVGVRLFGIRPETLLGHLGLLNGDRLETINGFNMASPEKALEAYARLRTASSLKVQVNRRGKPMTIELKIK